MADTKRKHQYLIAYKGDGNVLMDAGPSYLTPMTLLQAKRELRKLPCSGGMIYKIVPAKVKEVDNGNM